MPWAAWVLIASHACLPHLSSILVSRSGCLGPHEFTLCPHWSPALVSHWVLWVAGVYTCLPDLSPTLGASGRISLHLSPRLVSHSGCQGRMNLQLSPTHVFHTSLSLWMLWAALVYTCLPLVSHTCLRLWVLWAARVYTCLRTHTCLPHLSPTLGASGRMSLHLSPTLGALGRMSLHLSPTLGWPHEFTLVPTPLPHLSPTLVPWAA